MLTPPPSPRPPTDPSSSAKHPAPERPEAAATGHERKEALKRQTGRRFRLAVITIPLLLAILSLSSTFLRFDGPQSPSLLSGLLSHTHRSPSLMRRSPQTSTPPTLDDTPPTAPSSPPTLPTPFPQPFRRQYCTELHFRRMPIVFCQYDQFSPIPHLQTVLPSSTVIRRLHQCTDEFHFNEQHCLGTCNTNLPYDQCKLNMNWFANNLKASCTAELAAQNTLAVTTLTALHSFEVMHETACLQDASGVYCYVSAVQSSEPSDVYYYSLPLGLKLPKTIEPSCSPCSKSVMGTFANYLNDRVKGADLTALRASYDSASQVSAQTCGSSFSQMGLGSARSIRSPGHWYDPRSLVISAAVALSWFLHSS